MPPVALIGAGIASGVVGGIFNQNAANKGARPVNPGLNAQGLQLLSNLAGPSAGTIGSLASGGGQQAFQQMATALQSNFNIQQAQGLSAIKEQFGATGAGTSSGAAIGESNYLAQSSAGFLQTLANLQLQAQQQALGASEFALQSFMGPAFAYQGPKGSIVGAGFSGAGSGLQTMGLLNALNLGGGGGGGGGGVGDIIT